MNVSKRVPVWLRHLDAFKLARSEAQCKGSPRIGKVSSRDTDRSWMLDSTQPYRTRYRLESERSRQSLLAKVRQHISQ